MEFICRRGIIYQASNKKPYGEIIIRKEYCLNSPFLKILGKTLVIFSATLTLLTFSPLLAAEIKQRINQNQNFSSHNYNWRPKVHFSTDPLEFPLPPVEKRFQLIIPKIGVNSPIVPNVNPQDQKEYLAALKQGVAHALGSGLPGQEGENRTIYLFAHSTDSPSNIPFYNAIFYLLKNLDKGDEVIIWFWNEKFTYQVEKKEILPANNIDYFKPQNKEEILVLQTCWPPGTTLKQLVIIAKPK